MPSLNWESFEGAWATSHLKNASAAAQLRELPGLEAGKSRAGTLIGGTWRGRTDVLSERKAPHPASSSARVCENFLQVRVDDCNATSSTMARTCARFNFQHERCYERVTAKSKTQLPFVHVQIRALDSVQASQIGRPNFLYTLYPRSPAPCLSLK